MRRVQQTSQHKRASASRRDPALEQLWRERIAQREQNGLSVRKFCQQVGCQETTYYFWRRELKKRDRAARTPPTVRAESTGSNKPESSTRTQPLPVFLPARVELSSQATIEIVLADGMTVRIPDDFNERTLDSVLTVLERRAC